MLLSIIVPTYNTKEITLQCLDSIFEQEKEGDYEVILVDDASKDNTVDAVKQKYLSNKVNKERKNLKIIQNNKNLGFAKSINKGYQQSEGKYILVLNSDTLLKHGFFEELHSFIKEKLDILAFSGMLLHPDYKIQNHYYMKFPNFLNVLLWHSVIFRKTLVKLPLFKNMIFSKIDKNIWAQQIEQIPGACLFFKKQALIDKKVVTKEKIFDERFDFFFEDMDFSFQLHKKGIKRYLVASIKIIHLAGESLQKRNKVVFKNKYKKGLEMFCNKNYSRAKAKRVMLAFKIAQFLNGKSFN